MISHSTESWNLSYISMYVIIRKMFQMKAGRHMEVGSYLTA